MTAPEIRLFTCMGWLWVGLYYVWVSRLLIVPHTGGGLRRTYIARYGCLVTPLRTVFSSHTTNTTSFKYLLRKGWKINPSNTKRLFESNHIFHRRFQLFQLIHPKTNYWSCWLRWMTFDKRIYAAARERNSIAGARGGGRASTPTANSHSAY